MRRVLGTLVAVALLLGVSLGTASAGTLTLTNWWVQGENASISAKYMDGSTSYTQDITCGMGSFHATFDGATLAGPLYCLDVFHTFSEVGKAWTNMTAVVVPPDPLNPPPWNTSEIAWAYNKYAQFGTTGVNVAGIQLALWEISHEEAWRAHYDSATWYTAKSANDSDFYVRSAGAGAVAYATTVLSDVKDNYVAGAHLLYYDPQNQSDKEQTYSGKQGFVGDIPEPGSLLLLGLSLLGAAGLGWRRRRS